MDSLLQKIKPKMPRCSSLVIYSSETRTIPFTVPSSAPPYGGPGWVPGGGGGSAGARRCDSLGESGRSSSCDSLPGTPPTHHDSRVACRSPMSDMRGTCSLCVYWCFLIQGKVIIIVYDHDGFWSWCIFIDDEFGSWSWWLVWIIILMISLVRWLIMMISLDYDLDD